MKEKDKLNAKIKSSFEGLNKKAPDMLWSQLSDSLPSIHPCLFRQRQVSWLPSQISNPSLSLKAQRNSILFLFIHVDKIPTAAEHIHTPFSFGDFSLTVSGKISL